MTTFEIIEIVLLLAACYACYNAGVNRGISDIIDLIIDGKLVSQDEFDKFLDKQRRM